MNVIDITNSYISEMLKLKDLYAYEQSYPALFSHYFKYWARRKNFSNHLSRTKVEKRKKLIIETLKEIDKLLTRTGFRVKKLDIVLFVGQGTSNGHAFRNNDKFIVWLPLELYETKLQAKVFITHEIIHAIHYSHSPDFYFNNIAEKRSVIRQVISEGLATWLTMKILNVDEGVALWADYISKTKIKIWLQKCQQKERKMYKYVLKNFSSSNPKIGLFYANDPTDIVNYRAGYYVGLKLIEAVANKTKLSDKSLLKIPRRKFEGIAKKWLQERSS
jgi:uncharacterized protein YjaZ